MDPSSVQLVLLLIDDFAGSQFLNLTSALHSLHLVFETESVSCEPGGKCLGVSSSLFSWFLGQDPVPGPCPLPGSGNGQDLLQGGSSAWCPAAVGKGSPAAASASAQQYLFS